MQAGRIYVADPSIMMLNGYLSCVSKLCGPQFSYSAYSFRDPREIDVFISEMVEEWSAGDEYVVPSRYKYSGCELVEFEVLRTEVSHFIFKGQLESLYAESEGDDSTGGRLLWDIFEYYGLASINLNSDGVFHPLVKGPVYRLEIYNPEHAAALYFLVKIENMYALTRFIEWQADEVEA